MKISHINTPNDQLRIKEKRVSGDLPYRRQQLRWSILPTRCLKGHLPNSHRAGQDTDPKRTRRAGSKRQRGRAGRVLKHSLCRCLVRSQQPGIQSGCKELHPHRLIIYRALPAELECGSGAGYFGKSRCSKQKYFPSLCSCVLFFFLH